MVDTLRAASLMVATLTMGLSAGLIFTFSMAVMTGLQRTDDRTFVTATQQINVGILNGWFALSFGGAFVFTIVAAAFQLHNDGRPVLYWVLAALALYTVGVLVVTFGFSIPLNDELAAAGDPDTIEDFGAVRERFEDAWVRLNIIRAVAGTAAFGCLAWALVLFGRAS